MLERLQKVKNINSTNGYEFKRKKLGFVHMKKMMLNVHLLRVVKEMLAHTWWSSSGSEAPKLQKTFAVRILKSSDYSIWHLKGIGVH
jgi:hypothetical protein